MMERKHFIERLVAWVLVAAVAVSGLAGCSSNPQTGLTGNFRQDTLTLLSTLKEAIDTPPDAPNNAEIRNFARKQMNDYAARYRRDNRFAGSRSFTTMLTAVNAIAGYYTSTSINRPLPEKLKTRLRQEFDQVERALRRET